MVYIPEPDIIYRPSADIENLRMFNAMPKRAAMALEAIKVDPNITDIEMRLKNVFIIDNRDPGKGDIYIVTLVTDNVSKEPFSLNIKTFEDIHDNEALQIAPGGLTIYRNPANTLPRYLDFRILVMESDQEMRDAGSLISEITSSEQFKSVRDGIIGMVVSTNPATALITAGADIVIGLISTILKMNRDDQIIYIVGSFNDKIDHWGVDYGPINQKNTYSKVSYQVLVV